MNFSQLLAILNYLFSQFIHRNINMPTDAGKKLYEEALKNIGLDASPNDLVPDEYGCAESVTTICHNIFPDVPIITGTWSLWNFLKGNVYFVEVFSPIQGDIIVSPTDGNHTGHTGIFFTPTSIASNDSATGKFMQNYSLDFWLQRFKGKLPTYYFRRLV